MNIKLLEIIFIVVLDIKISNRYRERCAGSLPVVFYLFILDVCNVQWSEITIVYQFEKKKELYAINFPYLVRLFNETFNSQISFKILEKDFSRGKLRGKIMLQRVDK